MMRKVALVLALSSVVSGGALGAEPSPSAGGGGMNVLESGRPTEWSQPPNLDGLIGSSEIISAIGIETEIVNDFYFTGDYWIERVTWWGGYWNGNGCGDIGVATYWNLRFYDDGGCCPSTVLEEYVAAYGSETFVYCQAGIYPIFEYLACPEVWCMGNTLYWFSAQATDHAFPPQVGRIASAEVISCDSVFRSLYFGYPDWTPCIDVFGVPYDASQQLDDFICIGVSTERTTWGSLKALYR